MKKVSKIAIGTVVGAVLGPVISIVLLLLIIPFFVSAETYKNLLVAQVKKMTGRELIIAGDASLKLFPNVALSVEDVTLTNPAGFTDKELTRISRLSVNVALMPLLDKKLEMKGATLEGAVLALEEREDGTKSWELMPATKGVEAEATDAPATPAQKEAGRDLSNIILGEISIKDSAVTYRKPGAKPIELSGINLVVDSNGFASALTADFSASYQGGKVALNASVANPADLLGGKATAVDVKAEVPEAKIAFKGEAAMSKGVVAMGDLSINITDLPRLTSWATGKPAGAGPKAIQIAGTLSAKDNTYKLSAASLSVDGVKATGDIATTLGGAVPVINGKLAFGALDIDAITASSGKASAAGSEAPAAAATAESRGEGWSTKPMDLSALRSANADLVLSAEEVKTGKVKLGKTEGRIKLSGGKLRIDDIVTALYDGTAAGEVKVDASAATPTLGINMLVKSVQIEPLMTDLAGKSRLAGTANLNFNLTASGKSQQAMVSSLAGKGAMKVTDGAVIGINIGKFLRDAKQGFFSDSESERTDFAELSGSFTAASGIVSNNDLAMMAPLLRMTGEGTVNMPNKTVNYRLIPKLSATSKGQGGKEDRAGISIPLTISGPWSKLSITPDLAGMVEEGLKDPEALKENIKGIGDTLKNYNSKDDLKRAILGGGTQETAPATTEGTTAPAEQPTKTTPEDTIKGFLKGL